MKNMQYINLHIKLHIFAHFHCIFFASLTDTVYIFADFWHISWILLAYIFIFLAYTCIWSAYLSLFLAYFVHIFCIFDQYSLFFAYSVLITVCFMAQNSIQYAYFCIFLHILCISFAYLTNAVYIFEYFVYIVYIQRHVLCIFINISARSIPASRAWGSMHHKENDVLRQIWELFWIKKFVVSSDPTSSPQTEQILKAIWPGNRLDTELTRLNTSWCWVDTKQLCSRAQ